MGGETYTLSGVFRDLGSSDTWAEVYLVDVAPVNGQDVVNPDRLPDIDINTWSQQQIEDYLRTLSTMVATGVSTLESMEIAAEVSGNILYTRIWHGLGDKLKEGASLSEEMANFDLIPPCVCQMVAAGEQTGKLAAVLDRVAGFCEEDLDTTIRTATGMIEPAMIIIMGLVVGGIAMALLLPVFSLSKVVSS